MPERPAYRPDIDGLRAIAVLAVVAFHAFPDTVPGGFVGVDIFFVISGYLISTIIFRELDSGQFSFAAFFSRRARRIFPGLAIMLAASAAFGWLVLLPHEFRELGRHVAGSAGFVANLVFLGESGYFFAPDLKPLLHLWSLGIEEQFYIAWPLAVYAVWRRRLDAVVLVVMLLASFFLNTRVTYADRVSAFFLPFTRIWELLVGALLAYGVVRLGVRARARTPLGLSAAAGLLLLIAAMVAINKEKAFPGWWALLPTVGTALVIAAPPTAWINSRMLSWRPLVWVGLVSYPLYLWHWPVLSFARILAGETPAASVRWIAILVSVGLAWGTAVIVEPRMRFSRVPRLATVAVCVAVASAGTIGVLASAGFIQPRSASAGLDRFLEAATEPIQLGSRFNPIDYAGRRWFSRSSHHAETVLYVGDSKIDHYRDRIDALILQDPDRTKSAVFAVSHGCPPIPRVAEAGHPGCRGFVDAVARYIGEGSISTVVIGAAWANYFSSTAWAYERGSERLPLTREGAAPAYEALAGWMSDLHRRGTSIFLILDSPSGAALAPMATVRRSLISGFRLDGRGIAAADFSEKVASIHAALLDVARRAEATVIDPASALCDAVRCPSVDADGLPIYLDTGHFRPGFARLHASFIDVTIRAAPPRTESASRSQ
jgi:peptidoglycan/LPS O-acetylase OafA/YrhL